MSKIPPRYSTTEAARAEMPATIQVLIEIRDHAKSEIARVQAAVQLIKLGKLDQLPEAIDTSFECIPILPDGKVVQLNADSSRADAAAN